MKELKTIQTRNKLNDVFAIDEPGSGGAHHLYVICRTGGARFTDTSEALGKALNVDPESVLAKIQIQHGPRKDDNALNGVLNVDLLEIVRDQLTDFQNGPFSCAENAHALAHIEDALRWLNRRTENRLERGVLGTEQK